jgi:AcrR family transcriptional regulator
MDESASSPSPTRTRRSHAERTAETRARVMAAVVESIVDVGYQRTTAAEISKRAGVTWGAAQHHFGDKDGILVAVLRESFERFAEVLADPPREGESLEMRVALFVDRAAEHFGSDLWRPTFEILLNLPESFDPQWQRDMLDAWLGIWRQYFPGSSAKRQRTVDLMRYAISVLSGLATTRILAGESSGLRLTELGFLKDTLVREIGD